MKNKFILLIALLVSLAAVIVVAASRPAPITCSPRVVNTLQAGQAIQQMQYEGCVRFYAVDHDTSQDPPLTVRVWGEN